jgi:hypothetical protein
MFLRLLRANARLTYTSDAVAVHEADLDLPAVSRKMMTAGRCSAGIFRNAHPQAYRDTSYGMLDAHYHGTGFRWTAKMLWWMLCICMPAANSALEVSTIPFNLRAKVAKLYSGAAFAYGTTLAIADAPDSPR